MIHAHSYWQNGGTNCPACRGISSAVVPSRPLQSIVDVLLRAMPSKVRAERERQQADAIYTGGTIMRVCFRTIVPCFEEANNRRRSRHPENHPQHQILA